MLTFASKESPGYQLTTYFFRTPQDLVNYLEYLDNNSTAYLEYHQWRTADADLTLPYIQPTDKMICGSCKVSDSP